MMKFVRSIPLAISGLSLAFAALGNLLLPYGIVFRYLCGFLSAILFILFALKVFLDSPHAREEFKTPVPLSVLPTSTMAMMLLSTYLHPYLGILAIFLWYIGIILHMGIMILFVKRFVMNFQINNVYPSWLITFVGFVTISVTAPMMGARLLGQAVFYLGFVLYFVALALIIFRMTKPFFVLEPLRLTTAILAAPMGLLMVGYFSSFEERNAIFIILMLTMAVLSYIYVTIKMVTTFLKVKFYPTYSAFTFPYVISALAFRLGNLYLSEQGHYFLAPLATVSEWIAIGIVLYVSLHYIRFFRFVLSF